MRAAAITLFVLWPGLAAASDLAGALRMGDWAAATQRAAEAADPLAPRLVRYLRALTPGAAGAAEIAQVMTADPDWPQLGVLARRYADAVAGERDDKAVDLLCRGRAPATAPALLRCADAAAHVWGGGDEAARQAWLKGITDPLAEAAFMKRWGSSVSAADQLRRFDHYAWTDSPAAGGTLARQAVRLDPVLRPYSEALLALRRDDPAGPSLYDALPEAARTDPGLVLDLAAWYRRAHREGDAVRVWTSVGEAAEQAAPPARAGLFWQERNRLVRRLLDAHEDVLAYAVAKLPTAAPTAKGDAAFLSGWIALRRLGQPEAAAEHFRAVAEGNASAISNGRAYYWLGRALAAAGQADAATTAFGQAAAWPTTYYGQLAALVLDKSVAGLRERIQAVADPAWDEARALEFTGSELARAASLLTAWGQSHAARTFLQALEDGASDPGGRSLAARFATELGLPDLAVAGARLAGRDGTMLPGVGWPAPFSPPDKVERAVALGVIRQESSFDPVIRSPAGALGLMQLMPATAAQMARQIGQARPDLLDPASNMLLGTTYLAAQLDRFGAIPLALAAYNAGPNRVRDWLIAAGDPATGAIDPIDWVELIPFDETRNYVQRIVENIMIYRAHAGIDLPHPVLQWAGSGA